MSCETTVQQYFAAVDILAAHLTLACPLHCRKGGSASTDAVEQLSPKTSVDIVSRDTWLEQANALSRQRVSRIIESHAYGNTGTDFARMGRDR
jgi:hypothetical protein